jgi:multiple antibiotic resistance protein
MASKILRDALILLTTIDPVGTILVFASVSARLEPQVRSALAGRAIVIAAATLLGFLALGQLALGAMHVSLYSFQLAGGLFLLLFGIQMTFGDIMRHASLENETGRDPAVFPLAIPAIASPGALLAVVVLTDNTIYSVGSQLLTAGVLLLILGVTYVGMRWAGTFVRLLGRSGGAALIRILGMILAALAVEMAIQALARLGIIAAPAA